MAQRSILLSAAFAALAAAGPQLAPPPVPLNAQIGKFHLPVTCKIYGGLDSTFDVIATGTAPAYAAAGAEYYLTDLAGVINVPQAVINLGRQTGAVRADANVTINIASTNASPASVVAYSGTIPIDFPASGGSQMQFPGNNGTVAKVGPFTIDSSATGASLTQLGETTVSLQLYAADGSPGVVVPVVCGQQNVDFTLTSVSIDNTVIPNQPAYNPAPSNGYVPDFPTVPINKEFGFFKFPYNCQFGALGQQIIDLTIGGQLPIYLNPGQQFSIENAESFLDIPASLVSLAKTGFPSVTNFYTEVSSFKLEFTNTSPAEIEVANPPIVSIKDVTNANVNVPLPIPVPPYFPLTVGPVAAGANNTKVTFSPGNAIAYTALRDANNKVLFDFNVTCSPFSTLSLIGVGITTAKPGNYSLGTNLDAPAASRRTRRSRII